MDTIKLLMPNADADLLQAIFDRTQEPHFSIISRFDVAGTTVSLVEIVVESSMTIWFLAKQVEVEQASDRRIKDIIDNLKDTLATQSEEIKKKIEEHEKNKLG